MWSPEGKACVVLNFETSKPAVIGSLFTDLLLLLIMLLGLLRLRLGSSGEFSIGRFLWKQVRWCQFSLAVTNSQI
jgi:hypothetical protein